jgi:hypothetical protein
VPWRDLVEDPRVLAGIEALPRAIKSSFFQIGNRVQSVQSAWMAEKQTGTLSLSGRETKR